VDTFAEVLMLAAAFALTFVVPVAAIYPGWKKARNVRPEGMSVLILPLSGIALWMVIAAVLAAANVKGGSLTNVVFETPAVAWASAAIAYVRLRALGPGSRFEAHKGALTFAALLCVVVPVRAVVPELGE